MAHRKTERNPLFAGRWFEDDIILLCLRCLHQNPPNMQYHPNKRRSPQRYSKRSDPRSVARRPAGRSEQLAQVLTPQSIADVMACELLRDRPSRGLRILDPAVGPGT